MNKRNENIENVYHEITILIEKLLKDNYDPLTIAGVILNQSLSLYKSALSDDEYDQLIKRILDKKNIVEPYEARVLH